MPTNCFGSLRPKFFAGKTWYPLLYLKLFDTPTFLKHWTDAHKNFRHKETKNFRRKNVLPLFMYKIIRYPNFSEILKECSQIFSATWDKNFSTKICYTPYYPWNVSIPQNIWNIEGIPHEVFRYYEIQIFRRKTRYPLIYMKLFDTPCFRKHWADAQKIFGTVRQKVFNWKMWDPLLCIKFLLPQMIWNIERMPTEIFGTVRQKYFTSKTG